VSRSCVLVRLSKIEDYLVDNLCVSILSWWNGCGQDETRAGWGPVPNGNFGGQSVVVSGLACIRRLPSRCRLMLRHLAQNAEGAGHPRFVRSESMGEPPTLAETRKGGPARKLRPFLSACCRVLEKCLTRADTVREAMFQAWSAGAQL